MPDVKDLASNGEAIAELSARVIPGVTLQGPNYKLVVEGEKRVSGWWVSAPEIVFKPGGVLIFDDSAITRRSELFVVCQKISVESGVGRITWERNTPPTLADRGQAATGTGGGSAGAGGVGGAAGQAGADGLEGTKAPDLTLFVQTVSGNLELDFSGGPAGAGGKGQTGGTGGPGAQGSAARQARKSAFGVTIYEPYCEAGPGRGGDGGSGGSGGSGGTGGKGGRGGTVTICAGQERLPILRNMVNIRNDGGAGGSGGSAGVGGEGGPGGVEGQLASFCNAAGRSGSRGPDGSPGVAGLAGNQGEPGAQFDSYITDEQFSRLFQL